MAKLVCELPPGFDPRMPYETIIKVAGVKVPVAAKVAEVRVKKTKEEKDRAKRLYRKEYSKKPNVMAKIKDRLSNPAVIAKRKAYSEKPEVKARKKALAARNRAIRNVLKYENTGLYQEIINQIEKRNNVNECTISLPEGSLNDNNSMDM